jgi:hypothetical protein
MTTAILFVAPRSIPNSDEIELIQGTDVEVWTTNEQTYLQVLAESCNYTIHYRSMGDVPISELLGREVGVYNPANVGLHLEYDSTDINYSDFEGNVRLRYFYVLGSTRIHFDTEISFEELNQHFYGIIPMWVSEKTGRVSEYARIELDSN